MGSRGNYSPPLTVREKDYAKQRVMLDNDGFELYSFRDYQFSRWLHIGNESTVYLNRVYFS